MRKGLIPAVAALLFILTACGANNADVPFSAAYTIRPEETPTEVYYDVTYSDQTHVYRSDALDSGALCTLFEQSLFGEERETAARWAVPVRYVLTGAFTEEDAQAVSDFAAALEHVSGFPAVQNSRGSDANLVVRFDNTEQPQLLHETDANGRIRSVNLTIPAGWNEAQRRAAVNRYGMRACGFFFTAPTTLESVLRADKPAASLTDADYLLLEALYGQIEPGDARDVCVQKFNQFIA